MKFNKIRRLNEFDKDLRKLLKKFKTLDADLTVFIDKQLKLYHKLGIDNKGILQITDLGIDDPKIFKARKFACKALKGTASNSGIRIIYAYYEKEDVVELTEIYFKGDKKNEDKKRIYDNY